MNTPIVSVIVPVYNTEKYLFKCLSSIDDALCPNIEVIIVDDGSTDSSSNICSEFVKTHTQFKYIYKTNGGLINARKTGIELAKGNYIYFVDSDDWIDRTIFIKSLQIINTYNPDVITFDIVLEYSNLSKYINQGFRSTGLIQGTELTYLKENIIYKKNSIKFNIFPTLSNKIIKKSIISKKQTNVPISIRLGEDAAVSYPSMLETKTVYIFENEYFYHYRQHDESMTKEYNPRLIHQTCLLINYFTQNTQIRKSQLNKYVIYLLKLNIFNLIKSYSDHYDTEFHNKFLCLKQITSLVTCGILFNRIGFKNKIMYIVCKTNIISLNKLFIKIFIKSNGV